VLLTTQYLDEADALADEVTVIDHGRVIAHDTPQGLKRIVGGQRLTVRPADTDRLADVEAVLGAVGTGATSSPGRGVLSVPVADDDALSRVVAELAARRIGVTELSLHLPSLDEVFFSLTGARGATAPPTSTASPTIPAQDADSLEVSR
jgi:oleandomycin transport system ATP-binding protein